VGYSRGISRLRLNKIEIKGRDQEKGRETNYTKGDLRTRTVHTMEAAMGVRWERPALKGAMPNAAQRHKGQKQKQPTSKH